MVMAVDPAGIGERRLSQELSVRNPRSRGKRTEPAEKATARRARAGIPARKISFHAGTKIPYRLHGVPSCTFSKVRSHADVFRR